MAKLKLVIAQLKTLPADEQKTIAHQLSWKMKNDGKRNLQQRQSINGSDN